MKIRVLILLLLLVSLQTHAQAPKSFSSDPATFFKELKGYMELTNKKETEKVMDKFEEIWI
mgnify:CR=1 FL=1